MTISMKEIKDITYRIIESYEGDRPGDTALDKSVLRHAFIIPMNEAETAGISELSIEDALDTNFIMWSFVRCRCDDLTKSNERYNKIVASTYRQIRDEIYKCVGIHRRMVGYINAYDFGAIDVNPEAKKEACLKTFEDFTIYHGLNVVVGACMGSERRLNEFMDELRDSFRKMFPETDPPYAICEIMEKFLREECLSNAAQ